MTEKELFKLKEEIKLWNILFKIGLILMFLIIGTSLLT